METKTLTVSINRPISDVVAFLSDPISYPTWATKFFTGPVTPKEDGDFWAEIKMMGGKTGFRIKPEPKYGVIDMQFARAGEDFGVPTRVRVIPNGDGTDVLWTLSRIDGLSAINWKMGNFFMGLELKQLKKALEV